MKTLKQHDACFMLVVLSCLAASLTVNAQLTISSNFVVRIRGDKTNITVLAREVVRGNGHGPGGRSLVLFDLASGQAFVAEVTNDVYALKGRFFRVSPDAQSFWITSSRPGPRIGPTAETTTNLLSQSVEDLLPRENPYKRFVDLSPILKTESNLKLAQLLILRHAELSVEGRHFVVNFESYTGLRGKVLLDNQLNLVSMALTEEQQK